MKIYSICGKHADMQVYVPKVSVLCTVEDLACIQIVDSPARYTWILQPKLVMA